jgi:hypothetical protein
MATGDWQVGYDKSVTFLGVSLKIKGSSWDEHIEKLIVTHTQSGGVQGWVAGILDGEGSVQAVINGDALPVSFGLGAGVMGTMTWGIGGNTAFSIPCGITKMHYQSAVNGLVEYSFDVALNSEQGTYVRAA